MQLKRRFFLPIVFPTVLACLSGLSPGVCAQSSPPADTDREDDVSIIAASHASVVSVAIDQGPAANGRQGREFGTGVLVHPAGYVLTCAHLARDGTSGQVLFHRGEVRPVSVIARMPQYDVALLKTTPPDNASAVVFQRSRSPAAGESIYTIANLGNQGLATVRGNIAATGRRTRTDFTQVDDLLMLALPVVPGVSGGPVFSMQGQFLAIVFALSYVQPGQAGCFAHAIPIPQLTAAVQSVAGLESSFGLDPGLRLADTERGCRVEGTIPGLPAAEAELQAGDMVVGVGEWEVRNVFGFVLSSHVWAEKGTERPLELTIDREGKRLTKSLLLTRRVPQSIAAATMAKARPGCQLTVAELDKNGNAGPELLRAWVRSLDVAWTRPGDENRPQQAAWSGYLQVPVDGAYTFYLATPGRGEFRLADAILAEKSVDFPAMRVAGRQYLAAGTYSFELYMKGGEKPTRSPLYVEGPDIPPQPVPDHWLWTE